MPKFQEATARYSLHIHVVSELLRKFNEASLEDVSGLEQNMACAEDPQARRPPRHLHLLLHPPHHHLHRLHLRLRLPHLLLLALLHVHAQGKPYKNALQDLRALLSRQDLMLSPEDRIAASLQLCPPPCLRTAPHRPPWTA